MPPITASEPRATVLPFMTRAEEEGRGDIERVCPWIMRGVMVGFGVEETGAVDGDGAWFVEVDED